MKPKPKTEELVTKFKKAKTENPLMGNILVLSLLVKGKRLSKEEIESLFDKFCKRGIDYFDGREEILGSLYHSTEKKQ